MCNNNNNNNDDDVCVCVISNTSAHNGIHKNTILYYTIYTILTTFKVALSILRKEILCIEHVLIKYDALLKFKLPNSIWTSQNTWNIKNAFYSSLPHQPNPERYSVFKKWKTI